MFTRASQYNLEGMSDTWIGSFLGGDIPQLDGAGDGDSDGQEDFRIPRKKLGMGRPRRRSNRLDSNGKIPGNSNRREIPLTKPVDVKTSERNAEHVKTETTSKSSEEKSRESVWPQRARAIRTYSKKGMSALRIARLSSLDEDKDEKKGNALEKAIVTDVAEDEEEEEVEEEKKEEEKRKKKEVVELEEEEEEKEEVMEEVVGEVEIYCEDAFRLVLNESSDSDDNDLSSEGSVNMVRQNIPILEGEKISKTKNSTAWKGHNTSEVSLGSERMEIVATQENSELEAEKRTKIKMSTARKGQDASECHTPVITKYFHSPNKKCEGIKKGENGDKQSASSCQQSSGSSEAHVQSTTQALPHRSTLQDTYLRKSTLRKRKLSEVDKKDQKLSKGMTSRTAKQNSDLFASLSAVSGAMANLKVSLEDVSQTPSLNSKFGEARARLTNKCDAPPQNFTRIVYQKSSSPARTTTKERLSQKHSPLRSKKNEMSPLSKKRTSPKRKEDRMKKYGTLPVVITKSPRKNLADDNQLPEATLASQQSQVEESAVCTNVLSKGTGRDGTGTGYVLSRSGMYGTAESSSESSHKLLGLSSSDTTSVACSGGSDGTSRKGTGSFPSHQLSLASASGARDKCRNETNRTLSLQRRGLKRKLVMDAEKQLQSTPVSVMSGTGKKRKLSLKLKANNSRSFLRKEGVDETLVSPDNENLVEEDRSVCEVRDNGSKPLHSQQAGVNIDSSDGRSGFDNEKEFSLSYGLSDDITCVPSSPGEPDSSEDSPKHAEPSVPITESNSLSVSTKEFPSYNKSLEISDACVSTEIERKSPDNPSNDLNNLQLLSQQGAFPNEKDTELLANALFNMSYPSPLPCGEQCYSPPCPWSPLETSCDNLDPRDQDQSISLDGSEVLTLSSSIVEEDNVPDVVETQRSFAASSLNQVQPTAYFSPADTRGPEESSFLPPCPQLGETQSHSEYSSVETDNFGQRICGKGITGENDSLKSFTHRSNASEDDFVMEEKMLEENRNNDFVSNLEYEDKPHESKIVGGNESSESLADLTNRESVRTLQSDTRVNELTNFVDAQELSSSTTEEKEFILKLSTEEESPTTDAQPSVHSDLHVGEMDISMEEDNDNRVAEASAVAPAVASAFPTETVGQSKDQTSSAYVTQSRPNSISSNLGSAGVAVIKPLKLPPTSDELMSSLKDYGLPQCKYQRPFCSDPDDIPACPRLVMFWFKLFHFPLLQTVLLR